MKEYGKHVLWREYFDSTLSLSEGRKLPLSRCVKNPTLEELLEAARRAGFKAEAYKASYPRRSPTPSGYVVVDKQPGLSKREVLKKVAAELSRVRGLKTLHT